MHSDILVTFDDGTTESLSHYGVKGMKWGVRKKEKYIAKKSREYTRAANLNRQSASRQSRAASSISKHGSSSKWAGHLGDYTDTYDNKRKTDAAARSIVPELKKGAAQSTVNASKFDTERKRIESLPVHKMSMRQVKKNVKAGRAAMHIYMPDYENI